MRCQSTEVAKLNLLWNPGVVVYGVVLCIILLELGHVQTISETSEEGGVYIIMGAFSSPCGGICLLVKVVLQVYIHTRPELSEEQKQINQTIKQTNKQTKQQQKPSPR